MTSSVIIVILTGIAALLEKTGLTSAAVQNAISMLTSVLPVLIKEYQDALPFVKNIISILKTSDDITAEQIDALDEMEEKIDAEFDEAVEDYMKNHEDK